MAKTNTKELTPVEKKETNTIFLLIFPSLIVSAIAVFYSPGIISAVVVFITIYNWLMTKKFVQDYYTKKTA